MVRQKVNSKRIASIGYDSDAGIMHVEFPNTKAPNLEGSVYAYQEVEPETHFALMASADIGKFFADTIVRDRNNPAYKYALVTKARVADLTNPGLPNVRPAGHGESRAEFEADRHGQANGARRPTVTESKERTIVEDRIVQTPAQVDAAAAASVAQAKAGQLLAPGTPLPQTYEGLLEHATSVKEQISGLVKKEGVAIKLVVSTPQAYEDMGRVFVNLTAEKKLAQAWCDADRLPHNEAYKAGLQREKDIMGPYDVLKMLDSALVTYRQEEQAARRQAELAAQQRHQAILDAEAATRRQESRDQAERDAAKVEAAGMHQEAAIIRSAPVPVIAETAAPVVYATEKPKVDGLRETGTYKNEVTHPAQVPLYFSDRIRQAMNDEVARQPGVALDQARMAKLTLAIAAIFDDLYTLDPVKLNGLLKPKKELGINLIPGVRVWFAAKTSTTGR